MSNNTKESYDRERVIWFYFLESLPIGIKNRKQDLDADGCKHNGYTKVLPC